jgi:hypothetical protein
MTIRATLILQKEIEALIAASDILTPESLEPSPEYQPTDSNLK